MQSASVKVVEIFLFHNKILNGRKGIMSRINVCVSADENYSRYAAVVIASILYNAADDDELNFYVFDGEISDYSKEKILNLKKIKDCNINFVQVDKSLFKDYMDVKTHGYISLPAYYRMKAASLLPDVDRIIYFDCDIVVNSSLSELFNSDLDGAPIGGVSDINRNDVRKNPTYVNSGMLLMDLKRIRELNIEKEFLDWTLANFDRIKKGDQEIINEVLRGRIKLLDSKWNIQTSNFTNRSSYETCPNIIHYVGVQKPWKKGSWNYFKCYYRKYSELTAWAEHKSEKEIRDDDFRGMVGYLKYRPLFFLRPRFFVAVFYTYIKPLFCRKKHNYFFFNAFERRFR